MLCAIFADPADSDVVKEFQSAFESGAIDREERYILEFAATVTRAPASVTDQDVESLRDEHGLSVRQLVEIVILINIIPGYNRIVAVFGADPELIYHAEDWLNFYYLKPTRDR